MASINSDAFSSWNNITSQIEALKKSSGSQTISDSTQALLRIENSFSKILASFFTGIYDNEDEAVGETEFFNTVLETNQDQIDQIV